jgi:hypothetical protein
MLVFAAQLALPLLVASCGPAHGCECDQPADGVGIGHYEIVRRSVRLDVEEGGAVALVRDVLRGDGEYGSTACVPLSLPEDAGAVVDGWLETRAGRVPSKLVAADVAREAFDAYEQALTWSGEGPPRGDPQAAMLIEHDSDGGGVVLRVAGPRQAGRVVMFTRVRLASAPTNGDWAFSQRAWSSTCRRDSSKRVRWRSCSSSTPR